MSSRILLVKTGTASDRVRRVFGDYDTIFARAMGVSEDALDVADVVAGHALPPPTEPLGVVVTGSAAMVTDAAPWSTRTANWLHDVVAAETPLFAVCYGHQLLATAFGGEVGRNPRGREIGSITVERSPAADSDPMFGRLESRFAAFAIHAEAVLRLPHGARRLAFSVMDENQAYAIGHRTWAVQFHPELTVAIMRESVESRAEMLRSEGLDPEEMISALEEAPAGPALLRAFLEICGDPGQPRP